MFRHRFILAQIKPYLNSSEAIVITGMRRTGKTTLLTHLFDLIESDNKLYLDLENPLNRKYFEEKNYDRIRKTLSGLGIDFTKKSFLFLDEIQTLKNLPSIVKYLIDHYGVKFFLTGSASFYLKNLFTESLSGRKYIFELYPLTFGEFLMFKDSPLKIPQNAQDITRSLFESISELYDEYLQFGGFPGVVLKTTFDEKKKMLEEIFTSFYQLEVTQLGDFKKNEVIRDLMLLLMQRIGSRLDIQKISRELGIARVTLQEYLSFLEGTYFIKTIKPYSKGKDTEIRKASKVYLCDSGIAHHFARLEPGLVFENNVFQNLRIKGEINYYQRKSGVEVDFIWNKKIGYEVKIKPDYGDLLKLNKIAKEIGLQRYAIISREYVEMDRVLYGFQI